MAPREANHRCSQRVAAFYFWCSEGSLSNQTLAWVVPHFSRRRTHIADRFCHPLHLYLQDTSYLLEVQEAKSHHIRQAFLKFAEPPRSRRVRAWRE